MTINANGWVKLHRKLEDWEWYTDSKSVHLFIHILIKSNHVARKWRGIDVFPGQFITSRDKLSAQTGISTQSIRTILDRMKATNEITIKSTSRYTMVTVCNWATYQNDAGDINQPINQQSTSQITSNQPATNQQLTTNKNEKNVKNEKKTKREQHDAAVFASAPPDKFQDIRFCETWQDFCDHRAEKRSWLTERAIKAIFKKIAHFSVEQAVECLENSIAGGWTSVQPDSVKAQRAQSYGQPQQKMIEMPTDAEYAASENVERDANGDVIFD